MVYVAYTQNYRVELDFIFPQQWFECGDHTYRFRQYEQFMKNSIIYKFTILIDKPLKLSVSLDHYYQNNSENIQIGIFHNWTFMTVAIFEIL